MKKQNRRLLIGAGVLALIWWINHNKKTVPSPVMDTPVKPYPTTKPSTASASASNVSGYRYHATI